MEQQEYTVDYFINFYEAIPYDQWITHSYTQLINGVACHCALGHLGVFGSSGQLGLGSESDVETVQLIKGKHVSGRELIWSGAGGGFSVIAAISNIRNNECNIIKTLY